MPTIELLQSSPAVTRAAQADLREAPVNSAAGMRSAHPVRRE